VFLQRARGLAVKDIFSGFPAANKNAGDASAVENPPAQHAPNPLSIAFLLKQEKLSAAYFPQKEFHPDP